MFDEHSGAARGRRRVPQLGRRAVESATIACHMADVEVTDPVLAARLVRDSIPLFAARAPGRHTHALLTAVLEPLAKFLEHDQPAVKVGKLSELFPAQLKDLFAGNKLKLRGHVIDVLDRLGTPHRMALLASRDGEDNYEVVLSVKRPGKAEGPIELKYTFSVKVVMVQSAAEDREEREENLAVSLASLELQDILLRCGVAQLVPLDVFGRIGQLIEEGIARQVSVNPALLTDHHARARLRLDKLSRLLTRALEELSNEDRNVLLATLLHLRVPPSATRGEVEGFQSFVGLIIHGRRFIEALDVAVPPALQLEPRLFLRALALHPYLPLPEKLFLLCLLDRLSADDCAAVRKLLDPVCATLTTLDASFEQCAPVASLPPPPGMVEAFLAERAPGLQSEIEHALSMDLDGRQRARRARPPDAD